MARSLLRLKTRWRDGTTHLLSEPIELMERLAAQIPKPRGNVVLEAGVLAPHAPTLSYTHVPKSLPEPPATETQTRERDTWSELMRLTFGLDVLHRPRGRGRLNHIATILDSRVALGIFSIWDAPPVRRRSRLRAIPFLSETLWKQRPRIDAQRWTGDSWALQGRVRAHAQRR